MGIYAVTEELPNIPSRGVRHGLPPDDAGVWYMYGIPYHYYEKYRVRRHGFHGTSHFYVPAGRRDPRQADRILNIVTCHMGNGSSITAVKGGISVDTSMGLSPLPGIIMGRDRATSTRSWSPTRGARGHRQQGDEPRLNKESGLLGISGVSSDLRDIEEAADAGNARRSWRRRCSATGPRST